jgi:hypothetical protein
MAAMSKLLVIENGDTRAAQYTYRLNGTGFRNTRVIPTVGPVSVVESEAV